jgi:hypothetical protein
MPTMVPMIDERAAFSFHFEMAVGRSDEVDEDRDAIEPDQCSDDLNAADKNLRPERHANIRGHFRNADAGQQQPEGATSNTLQEAAF